MEIDKTGWVEFKADSPETYPELYRACMVVSDAINWEEEELAYWDGKSWRNKLYGNLGAEFVVYRSNFRWHYITFPPKP